MADRKVAVITAAGSGIGAGVARELAGQGYKVAILSSSGKGEALAKELDGLGVTGSNLVVADLERLVELTLAEYGRIDALVNSAGHAPKGPILEISDEDWHLGLDVYLLNVVRMCRLVTPAMERQGKGAIVNISSYVAYEPGAAFPLSSVFRAGLASFTRLYADRYAASNIRINNLLPGFIDSLSAGEKFLDQIPMARVGKVEEMAAAAAFLLSDGAGYITGENIRVDGGISRSI